MLLGDRQREVGGARDEPRLRQARAQVRQARERTRRVPALARGFVVERVCALERGERRRVEDAVVRTPAQVGQRPAGQVARDRLPGDGGERELGGEARDDAVHDSRGEGEADEAPAPRAVGERAAAGGLHARLLEQRAVGGEHALGRVLGGGERAVVLGNPELGVLGVQDLVVRDAVGAEDRAALESSGADLFGGTEELGAVEVDGAAA